MRFALGPALGSGSYAAGLGLLGDTFRLDNVLAALTLGAVFFMLGGLVGGFIEARRARR